MKSLTKAFGLNEFGIVDIPKKISNVKVSRFLHGEERGCTYCFPHGIETNNSTEKNKQRSWKKSRKTKYKNN